MLTQPASPSFSVQTVPEAVVEHLRGLILSGALRPGQRLVQDELAGQLGVSRTPVREALKRLEHEGLVSISSYRGATVTELSPRHLKEVYAVRVGLESHATYLAATAMTPETLARLDEQMAEMGAAFRAGEFERLLATHHHFHLAIYAASGAQLLTEVITQYLGLSNVYQRLALSLGRGASDPINEHSDLLTALRRGEPEAAGRMMREHLEWTQRELLEILNQSHFAEME